MAQSFDLAPAVRQLAKYVATSSRDSLTAQGLLTWHLQVALPCHTQAQLAQRQFEAAGLGPGSYHGAVLSAHAALGLVAEVGPPNDRHAMPALQAPRLYVCNCCAADLTALMIMCSDSAEICFLMTVRLAGLRLIPSPWCWAALTED